MKPSQQPQTSDMINLLMQILQNQQWQMNQMMIIFMNFVCISSFTLTPSAVFITHITLVSLLSINNDWSYIKFPDPPLFNDDHNEYLVWKQKTLDKLLAEDWKYVKMGIQADYFWQHYINSCLDNNTAAKVLPWLDLNLNASMKKFWIFMDLQFKDNQLAEWTFSKLSSLRQKEEVWIYV